MRRTLDEVTDLARTKNPVASSGLLKERASAQLQLGRAEAILRSGRLLLLDTALYQRLRALDHDEMRSEDLTPVRESLRPFVGRALDWNQLDDAWNIAR
jgi:hypothetical protein